MTTDEQEGLSLAPHQIKNANCRSTSGCVYPKRDSKTLSGSMPIMPVSLLIVYMRVYKELGF